MPKQAKGGENSSGSSSDEDERGNFESAIDPAFCGGQKEVADKSRSKKLENEDELPFTNNDKYADQRKHLSKKLAQYLDSVIEYSDDREEESCSKKKSKIVAAPKDVRLLSSSTVPLPSTDCELNRRKLDVILETAAHNKRAKEMKLKKQQKSDSDSSSSDDEKPTKKSKKLSSDLLACVVEPFPSK